MLNRWTDGNTVRSGLAASALYLRLPSAAEVTGPLARQMPPANGDRQPALVEGWIWNCPDALVSTTPLLVITAGAPRTWNPPHGVAAKEKLLVMLPRPPFRDTPQRAFISSWVRWVPSAPPYWVSALTPSKSVRKTLFTTPATASDP